MPTWIVGAPGTLTVTLTCACRPTSTDTGGTVGFPGAAGVVGTVGAVGPTGCAVPVGCCCVVWVVAWVPAKVGEEVTLLPGVDGSSGPDTAGVEVASGTFARPGVRADPGRTGAR